MRSRESYISHWKRLWNLHGHNEPVRIVGAWLTEPPDLLQVVYTIDGVPGLHGLRRPIVEATTDEDVAWSIYIDVWDVLEPHDIPAAVEHDGVLWYGHVTEGIDLSVQGERFI